MKQWREKDIRKPLLVYSDISPPTTELLIGEEFKDIINKHCPGKLYKLMKQRVPRRHQSQSVIETKLNNPKQVKAFEMAFYK
jgi:hypothetical protein